MDAEDRRRYARQLLLPEVGERGQAALSGHCVALRGEPRAVAVAELYLSRAGVAVGGGRALEVAAPEDVRALAGRPELEPAASFVAGALAAVEEIKRVVGAGAPGPWPEGSLTGPSEEPA